MYKFKFQDQATTKIMAIGIFLFFFLLYFYFSLLLAQTGVFSNYGIFFELDTPRVIGDMTIFDANHYRTKVHPLFVLLTNPAGMLLSNLLKSHLLTAMLLNSFFGALGATLAFLYFKLMTEDIYNACFLTCFFGLTTSQFFLSAIPETGALSILSLMVTYTVFLVAVKYKRDNFWVWVLAGMFTVAVTTTNFVQTFICFTASRFMQPNYQKRPFHGLAWVVTFLIFVLACAAVLAKIQQIIYPSASLFYVADSYQEDFLYTSMMIFQSPLTVIGQLLKHFFYVNIVASIPDIYSIIGQDKPALTFSRSLNYAFVGWLAVGSWLALLVAGTVQSVTKKLEIPLRVGFTFAICLLFNFALHSIYGRGVSGEMEYFPYTGNFSFLALSGLAYFSLPSKYINHVLLGILALLVGINNIMLFIRILNIYG
jgi:hypothetical protein